MITKEQVLAILPNVGHLDEYFAHLLFGMEEFQIKTPARIGGYIAQIGHESASFHALKEYASGLEYQGREDLGNVMPGDGVKFKGRGAIQITGRSNYFEASKALYEDTRLLDHPELLEQAHDAFLSSAWWWNDRGLNEICDLPEAYIHPGPHQYTKIQWMTVKINGGLNGYPERLKNYQRARAVLGF